jgi:hypothetical protein
MSSSSSSPLLGSFIDPTSGLRRSARIAEAEAARAALETTDVAVDDAVDAVFDEIPEKGGRKKRGGGKFTAAVGKVITDIKASVGTAGSAIDAAAAKFVENLGTISAVSGGVGAGVYALNHPTLFGNIAQLAAQLFGDTLDSSVTSTWGDWFGALKDILSAGVSTAGTLASQTLQGPVVPFAIASAVMIYRAKKSGKTLSQLLADDARGVYSGLSRAATAQIQAAMDAYQKEAGVMAREQLRERGRAATSSVGGPGASSMRVAVGNVIPLAVRPGAEGAVPASAVKADVGAPIRRLAPSYPYSSSSSSSSSAAAAAAAAAAEPQDKKGVKRGREEAAAPAAVGPGEEDGAASAAVVAPAGPGRTTLRPRKGPAPGEKKEGGRKSRKPRQSRQSRRRTTRRRKAPKYLKAPKFIY